jgi:hypothetical protein
LHLQILCLIFSHNFTYAFKKEEFKKNKTLKRERTNKGSGLGLEWMKRLDGGWRAMKLTSFGANHTLIDAP